VASLHPLVNEELELLAQVEHLLARLPGVASASEQAVIAELRRLRELLLSGTEHKDQAALMEQWNQQTALLQQLRSAAPQGRIDASSPYFGHLRLREAEGERDLCLGRATRLDGGLRIVDWRNAPISRLFYRYQQGEEYEETLGARVRRGTVAARRTVTIRDGVLVRIEAPEGTFARDASAPGGWHEMPSGGPRLGGGEGSALRAHAPGAERGRRLGADLAAARRRVDKRLTDVAGLIDPAQFDLITRPGGGFLVIRGAAGSGKTTVALHRIAYLAYADRRIDSERTLFLVFSRGLAAYVSHVLPSLGVRRVRVCTFHDWAAEQCRRVFPLLPRAERQDTPADVAEAKLHPALARALERHVRETPGPASPGQALDDWASVLGNASLLRAAFPPGFGHHRLERVAEWCRERADELYAWLQAESGDESFALDLEDWALLLRVLQLRVGPLRSFAARPLRYLHLALDEVQDFSPIEVRVLLECLEPGGSITLAGDSQQHIAEQSGFVSWSHFLEELGVPGAELHTLRVSYRTSAEVMTFSRALLGPLVEEDEAPRATRSGPPVEVFEFTDTGACVAFLAEALAALVRDEPLASVAVLTSSPEVSELYAEGLARGDVPRLRRVVEQDFTFAPGIEVTEVEQAKGLEFDYVVLVDASAASYPATPLARRLLHVGATRAVHQLWVTSAGPPSPVVTEAMKALAPR
jgi:DNA helicase-2/ATP-dependent DNA helicase PcrA